MIFGWKKGPRWVAYYKQRDDERYERRLKMQALMHEDERIQELIEYERAKAQGAITIISSPDSSPGGWHSVLASLGLCDR